MTNGLRMTIKENLNMRSTLKNILKDRILLLTVSDILVVIWIIWSESRVQYEPPLWGHEDTYILPIVEQTYNVMIFAILINIVLVIGNIKKYYRKTLANYELAVFIIYFIFVLCSLLWGYSYIASRSGSGIIDEGSILFCLPIMLFGEETITSVINVENVYISLCVILISSCIVYIYQDCCQNEIR